MKFCTIILKGCLHYYYTFSKSLLTYTDTAESEIQSTTFVSRQTAMENIYLTT